MSPQNQILFSNVQKHLSSRNPLRVLEAGCGSTSHLSLDPSWQLTGIDLSQRQLDRNTNLHEKVLGNLETHDWDTARFDLIVCWDVIEHLPNPNNALLRMMRALAPGGLLVLAFPHLRSVKGIVTKLTPYWAHVAFYRYFMGQSNETAEANQFPTYLRRDILPDRIIEFSRINGLECCYSCSYEGPVQADLRRRNPIANAFFAGIKWIGLNDSDSMLILRRPFS